MASSAEGDLFNRKSEERRKTYERKIKKLRQLLKERESVMRANILHSPCLIYFFSFEKNNTWTPITRACNLETRSYKCHCAF
jgi:hypothetical protein